MAYKIFISPVASENLSQAVKYYKKIANKNVALNFLKDYKRTIHVLKRNQYFQIKYKNYRALPFKKFPYIVFFIVDEETKTIFINAVFHTSKNPSKYP